MLLEIFLHKKCHYSVEFLWTWWICKNYVKWFFLLHYVKEKINKLHKNQSNLLLLFLQQKQTLLSLHNLFSVLPKSRAHFHVSILFQCFSACNLFHNGDTGKYISPLSLQTQENISSLICSILNQIITLQTPLPILYSPTLVHWILKLLP